MEFSGLEKYIIERLEKLEKENLELKLANSETHNTQTNVKVEFVLKEYFDTKCYDWYINENNLADYKKALETKNFKWLDGRGYSIESDTYNVELSINGNLFRLQYSGGNSLSVIGSPKYVTREEAENALLKELKHDIEKVERKQN